MEMAKNFVSWGMTQSFDTVNYDLLSFGFGSILSFAGLVLLIRQYKHGSFLSLCCLSLGLAYTLPPMWAKEILVLMVWPSFYLHVRLRHQPLSWRPAMIFHFLIAALWGLGKGLELTFLSQWFDALSFLQFVPYVIFALVDLYRQFRSRLLQLALQSYYSEWTFLGLLIVFFIRLALPLFPIDQEFLHLIFMGTFGLYLLGLFSFSVQGPFRQEGWTFQLAKEEASNYEEELKRRLDLLLQREKIFKVPDLTLQELSRKMQIRSSALSGFLSNSLGRNFNEVINEYRVAEVKRLMGDPNTDPKATLMELAYQSGFNSKATFNRIFKEATGMTPKAYRTQTLES